jgi:hypothetical protein
MVPTGIRCCGSIVVGSAVGRAMMILVVDPGGADEDGRNVSPSGTPSSVGKLLLVVGGKRIGGNDDVRGDLLGLSCGYSLGGRPSLCIILGCGEGEPNPSSPPRILGEMLGTFEDGGRFELLGALLDGPTEGEAVLRLLSKVGIGVVGDKAVVVGADDSLLLVLLGVSVNTTRTGLGELIMVPTGILCGDSIGGSVCATLMCMVGASDGGEVCADDTTLGGGGFSSSAHEFSFNRTVMSMMTRTRTPRFSA